MVLQEGVFVTLVKKDCVAGGIPHSSMDIEAAWTKSGWCAAGSMAGNSTWSTQRRGSGFLWLPTIPLPMPRIVYTLRHSSRSYQSHAAV
jgi:hypothetical protein